MKYLPLIIIMTLCWTPNLQAQSVDREPEAAFQVKQLSNAQLEGFRLNGLEKVSDFVELLKTYQDKSLAPEIRKQCENMLLDLFNRADSQLFYFDHQKLKRVELTEFLAVLQKLKRPIVVQHLDDHETSLQPIGDSYLLKTKLELLSTTKSKTALRKQVELDVIIKKEIKQFGSNEIEIWQVFLGDMSVPIRP